VNAVLVRRHGLFVWGDSWEQAKTQCESFDYLFESCVRMRQIGIDFSQVPSEGTYRVDNDEAEALGPPLKRLKTGFNGSGKADNEIDMSSNPTPILPRDGKHLLLDIEGCTSSISFVKETLFPFVSENIDTYAKSLEASRRNEVLEALLQDLSKEHKAEIGSLDDVGRVVKFMVQKDLKLASLKALQGQMWRSGYENGELKGHVFPDILPFLKWMESSGVRVHIFSSGSIQAQKLLFSHSDHGDLTKFLDRHFDISTSGNKKEANSYKNIAKNLGISPSELVFCSDSEAELKAAKEAGIDRAIMTVRPGNEAISTDGKAAFSRIFSLMQLCGA